MNTKPAPPLSWWRIIGHVFIDLLFAVLVLSWFTGRWLARQVLGRLAYWLLLAVAAVLLTDKEKGEPQPSTELDHSPY